MNGRMPIASVMADETAAEPAELPKLGAKNVEPDPGLIKLSRSRPKIGALTALGVLFLAVFFLLKLNPDRRFAGNGEPPTPVTAAELAAGKIDDDAYVAVPGEPVIAHAVRAQTAKNSLGLRVVPVRGTAQRVWLVLDGDGWADPTLGPYVGRVRELSDLPFSGVVADFLAAHPRPVFATAAAVRAGLATGTVKTVAGEEVRVRTTDRVGFDVVDPGAAVIVAAYNERLPSLAAWTEALTGAGIGLAGPGRDDRERAFFDVKLPDAVATVASKLEAAGLWAARVDPVTHHQDTTWGALVASGPAGFSVGSVTIPDAQIDLIGLHVIRAIPDGAVAVIVGENPQGYWYVLPVTIVVGLIALLFAWALARAIKRDFLPA